MNPLWVVGVAFVGIFGFLLLRQSMPQTAPFLPVAAILLLFAALLPQLEEILSAAVRIGEQSGMDDSSLSLILRGIGIGLVTRVASGICFDCGQRSLGETVDYCGQIAIVSLAVPMILKLAEGILDLKL